jgi:hypothetical protein
VNPEDQIHLKRSTLSAGFDDNGLKYHKVYYLSTHMKASFVIAQSYCHSLGMELATFETKDEFNWFSNIFVARLQTFDPAWCYIGGMRFFNDRTRDKTELKNHWYWERSGKKINFGINWDPHQPDNNTGNQWCLAIAKMNNTTFFADVECFNRDESFICQRFTVGDASC